MNCPINEETADEILVGRCWFYLRDGKICERHGDVSIAVKEYREKGTLMKESEFETIENTGRSITQSSL